jgi:hypothetical protein
MKSSKLAFVVCAIAVALGACSKEEEKNAVVPSDGKVEGTLTINGKTFPLKYVYAAKKRGSDPGEAAGLDVLITNEPISYELLSKIFLELEVDFFRREEHTLLKGASVVALYFEVPGYRLRYPAEQLVDFNGMLMTPEAVFDYSGLTDAKHEFTEFSLKDGSIAAKAESKWEQTETDEAFKEIKIAASYSLSFDAKVSDQTLLSRGLSSENKSWQQSLSKLPEEGKADGALTVSQRVANLTFAYARKEQLEDGKADGITVLLTDTSIPKEFLLLSFERGLIGEGVGLRLRVDQSGTVLQSLITYPNGQNGMFDSTSITDFKVENGRVAGAVENKEKTVDEKDPDKDSYSVRFDAPLKN